MNEQQHNPYIIPLSIVISGVLVAAAVMYTADSGSTRTTAQVGAAAGGGNAPTKPEGNGNADAVKAVVGEDHILGDPSAPVKIVEFSDLECPFCSRFHETMKQIMDEYGKSGKVAWVYRHFPLESIHSSARAAANGAECATELGGSTKFWAFIDTVFERQGNGLSLAMISQVAEDIGLNRAAFDLCVSSGKHNGTIDAHLQDALASGGLGTPYSIVIAADGRKLPVSGALPFASIKSTIEQALGAK